MSSVPTPKLESTKLLKVYQGRESDNVYWTCFDLLKKKEKKVKEQNLEKKFKIKNNTTINIEEEKINFEEN